VVARRAEDPLLSDAGTAGDFCFHVYVVNADGSGELLLGRPTGAGSPS
jgi:hypothetical protein